MSLTSCASAQQMAASLKYELGYREEKIETEKVEVKAPTFDEFMNGSFETLDSPNTPGSWSRFGSPEISQEERNEDLESYARITLVDYYMQSFDFPVPTWQTVALRGIARSEFGLEPLRIDFFSLNSSNNSEDFYTITPATETSWSSFATSYTRRPSNESLTLRARGRFDLGWVDLDSLVLVDEAIKNPNFSNELSNWEVNGEVDVFTSPTLFGNSWVALNSGSAIYQEVAHAPYNATYFLHGYSQGEGVIHVDRLASEFSIVEDSSTSRTLSSVSPIEFLEILPLNESNDAHLERVTFQGSAPTTFTLTQPSRGWFYCWPETFQPVLNSPTPSVRFAAAWPGLLDDAEIRVINDSNSVVDTVSYERDETTVWVDYTGTDLPAGDYTVEFELISGSGESVLVSKPFTLERPAGYPASPLTESFDNFPRMPWVWLANAADPFAEDSVERFQARLQEAADDGFDPLFIIASVDQFPLVKTAAENVGVPYIIFDAASSGVTFRGDRGHQTWDVSLALDYLKNFDLFLESELFKGIYIFDEPNVFGEDAVERVEDTIIVNERLGKYPLLWTSLNPGFSYYDPQFSLISSFDYPITSRGLSSEELLVFRFDKMEEAYEFATQNDRDYIAGVQGFSQRNSNYVPTPEESMAQLGLTLALGARGYFVFTYTSIGGFASLRTHQHEPSRRLESYREFNSRIASIESTILDLSRERLTIPSDGPYARLARSSADNPYMVIVNTNTDERIAFDALTDSPTQMINIETLEETDTSTTHTAMLGPGDWGVFLFQNKVPPVEVQSRTVESAREAPSVPSIIADEFETPFQFFQTGVNIAGEEEAIAGLDGQSVGIYTNPNNEGFELKFSSTQRPPLPRTRFLEGNRVLYATRSDGFRLIDLAPQNPSLLRSFFSRTGKATDALPVGDDWWIAQGFWGVTRGMFELNGSFTRYDQFFAREFDILSIHGPFQDGSVIAVEQMSGPQHLRFTNGEIQSESLGERNFYLAGSLSENNQLAVPMMDRGVRVYDLDEFGNLVREYWIDQENFPEIVQAWNVAWLDEGVLAVNDPRFGVRFYDFIPDGSINYLGLWTSQDPPFFISSIASRGDEFLYVGIRPERLLKVDLSALLGRAATNGWFMY